ncbi:MAG: Rrf2 family transcriptional regulator [bacterium]|nr:Rrf2 family transcriptional regulator [bacterium]
MKLSKECRYGLDALTFLAREPAGTIVASADLADTLDISPAFLSKILQRLARAGIVRGHRGAVRGYALDRDPRAITVRAVAEVLDGDDLFARCIFWSERCSQTHPCPLHPQWARVRPQIERELEELRLADLASRARRRRR